MLDREIDVLHDELAKVADEVLTAYPHHDPHTVGNWQLLAAIDSLIARNRTAANYHLAWFISMEQRR
ncbi:hypothetical protein I553_5989 [Mycobacterium xenopi 4042]|uniref:DUF5631 domain-containing protein n=1 Tax=Mycobacterium xenopi 4042 TaxID=1299334 RepID=X8BE37_MYCXE|nr:hypothetical protein I553_5989 [Mycobacterium xenopi 4042]